MIKKPTSPYQPTDLTSFLTQNIHLPHFPVITTHKMNNMPGYADNPTYADITPLPTDEGGPFALATIAYTPRYAECMSYLRALMAQDERSPRALALTEDLIKLNPAHYTVWLFRAACLAAATDAELAAEVRWLDGVAREHPKNYQVWHHRQLMVDRHGACGGERAFTARMFADDPKNYHVWSYRQWLVRRFGLWPTATATATVDGAAMPAPRVLHEDEHRNGDGNGDNTYDGDTYDDDVDELSFTAQLIEQDPRNNSAWNHRWYVLHGRDVDRTDAHAHGHDDAAAAGVKNPEVRAHELAFAQHHIRRAPRGESAWSYLRAIAARAEMPLGELRGFVEGFTGEGEGEGQREVVSPYALDLLARIQEAEGAEGGWAQAAQTLELLASTYDPIRKNYWEYRKSLLGGAQEEVVI